MKCYRTTAGTYYCDCDDYDNVPDMLFEICSNQECTETKTIRGGKEYWTYPLSKTSFMVLFTTLQDGVSFLGAGPNDDIFVLGHIFMK